MSRAATHRSDLSKFNKSISEFTTMEPIARLEPAPAGDTAKRLFDNALAALTLVILFPVLLAIACAILLETGTPILFRQKRVGQNSRLFLLLKFRSMRTASTGPSITTAGDSRITALGKFLRKYKLDELPQLWNVLRGDMSLVGPRPEVAEYVDADSPVWRRVLTVRPGVTDPASIAYRHEEELLAKAPDPLRFYKETVLPAKLALNVAYLEKRTLWLDVAVILQTVRCAAFPGASESKEPGSLVQDDSK